MDILFVYPGKYHSSNNKRNTILNKLMLCEQPCFGILASLTQNNHNISVIDDRIQDIDFNVDYDLVGITSYTPNAPRAYDIADEFRKRGMTVVLGGWHPTALPLESKQHADSIVIGEAEETWPELLQDFENGALKHFYRQRRMVDPSVIPPSRKIMKKSFSLKSIVQATRGCPNRCEFCALTNRKYGHIYRVRPIENVIDEIKSLPHKFLSFCDDSLTIDPDYSKKLFGAMRELNKKFYCNGNVNVLNKDDNLLKLAQDAGCKIWMMGLESISQKTIDFLGKKTNKVKDYAATIKKIHDYGMIVQGNFIFGFDTDQKDIFDKTIETIYDWGIDVPEFTVLTPYPGTPLYDRLDKEGRIFTKDWSKYDLRTAVFRPRHMSPKELEEGTLKVQKAFSSSLNIIKSVVKSMKLGGFYQPLINGFFNWLVKTEFT